MTSLAQPEKSKGTKVEVNTFDSETNTDVSDDNELQPPQTFMKSICLQMEEDVPRPR